MANDSQTNVRLPVDLKAWLQQQADESRRTFTAEISLAIEFYKKYVEQQKRKEAVQ